MAVRAHFRSRYWRRTVITGLLALLAALPISGLAAARAAASPADPGSPAVNAVAFSLADPGSPAVNAVAFSPDGTLLAAGYGDGTVRLWVTATGTERGPALRAGSGPVTAVAFSPDGAIVVGADAGGTIRRWSPAAAAAIGPPLQAGSGVNAVAFGPGGTLASAGANGAVMVWNIAGARPGRPVHDWFILVAAVLALALA